MVRREPGNAPRDTVGGWSRNLSDASGHGSSRLAEPQPAPLQKTQPARHGRGWPIRPRIVRTIVRMAARRQRFFPIGQERKRPSIGPRLKPALPGVRKQPLDRATDPIERLCLPFRQGKPGQRARAIAPDRHSCCRLLRLLLRDHPVDQARQLRNAVCDIGQRVVPLDQRRCRGRRRDRLDHGIAIDVWPSLPDQGCDRGLHRLVEAEPALAVANLAQMGRRAATGQFDRGMQPLASSLRRAVLHTIMRLVRILRHAMGRRDRFRLRLMCRPGRVTRPDLVGHRNGVAFPGDQLIPARNRICDPALEERRRGVDDVGGVIEGAVDRRPGVPSAWFRGSSRRARASVRCS